MNKAIAFLASGVASPRCLQVTQLCWGHKWLKLWLHFQLKIKWCNLDTTLGIHENKFEKWSFPRHYLFIGMALSSRKMVPSLRGPPWCVVFSSIQAYLLALTGYWAAYAYPKPSLCTWTSPGSPFIILLFILCDYFISVCIPSDYMFHECRDHFRFILFLQRN